MGFYATDTLEPASPAITGTRRARRETACGRKPLRGPIHNAISGYRFYNPELGRWVNRDPIEERGGLNVYAFVGNDVARKFDRLGLRVFVVLGDDREKARADVEKQISRIRSYIVRIERLANDFQDRNNMKYYFDGELLDGGYDEFIIRLNREKEVTYFHSKFKNIEDEVNTVSASVNKHLYPGDVTLYLHHGSGVGENRDPPYTVNLTGNPLTPIDDLVKAIGEIEVKMGSLVHVACFTCQVGGRRPARSFTFRLPDARREVKTGKTVNNEWVTETVYRYANLEPCLDNPDCFISWGSTIVESIIVPQDTLDSSD